MKVQLSINDKLMERVDDFAEKNYYNRSSLFQVAMTEYLNAKEMQSLLPEMVACMRSIADNGNIDDETQAKINDIERLMRIVTGK